MAFDANDLSPHEHFVVERTSAGEIADFTPMAGPGGAKPIVRAGFLRKLMLGSIRAGRSGRPACASRARGLKACSTLRIVQARAPRGCRRWRWWSAKSPEPIDLSHARLARFSLQGSRLSRLVAVETRSTANLICVASRHSVCAGRNAHREAARRAHRWRPAARGCEVRARHGQRRRRAHAAGHRDRRQSVARWRV
jgi:hypothetical protein